MEMTTFLGFLTASVLLTLAPGPDNMYLLAKSLAEGARTGTVLAAGLASGIVFHTTLVVLGVAAFLQSTPAAMAGLKYAGAGYLLFLAWNAFRASGELQLQTAVQGASYGSVYRRGVLMNVLNPKVLLFFLAFLPQFVEMGNPNTGHQLAFLGLCFAIQAFLIFSVIAFFAGHIRKRILTIRNIGKIMCRVEGTVLTAIAVILLLE